MALVAGVMRGQVVPASAGESRAALGLTMATKSRDLPARTLAFAKRVRAFVNQLPRSVSNWEDGRQLVRASGSVAANYVEAQEGLSRRDFFYRIKVCRKEAREVGLWLELLDPGSPVLAAEQHALQREADELKRIFSVIASKDDTTSGPSPAT